MVGDLTVTAQPTDLQEEHLIGPVKSVYLTSFVAKKQGKEILKGLPRWEEWGTYNKLLVYNRQGYVVEEHNYTADGTIGNKTITTRDSAGRELEVFYYDMNDTFLVSHVTISYDEKGNKTGEAIHHYRDLETGKELSYAFNSEYNAANQKIKQTGGQYGYYHSYTYNKQGQLAESYMYDSTGHLMVLEQLSYDKNGYIAERKETTYRADDTLRDCNQYKRDSHGNTIEWIICDSDCKPITKIVREYNTKHDVVKFIQVDGEGKVQATYTYQFVYDQHGNWVQQYVYLEGEPTFILERTIEYF